MPDLPESGNVKIGGAAGDGVTDDTQAFLKAIQNTPNGAIFIPPGRYVITNWLKITRSNIALRGAGPDNTVLYFPKPLLTAVGPPDQYSPVGSWSWGGGFLSFIGENSGGQLAAITRAASRGDSQLTVGTIAGLCPGQWVRVVATNTDGTLGRELEAGQLDTSAGLIGKILVDFPARITSVSAPDQVIIDRPLRVNLRGA